MRWQTRIRRLRRKLPAKYLNASFLLEVQPDERVLGKVPKDLRSLCALLWYLEDIRSAKLKGLHAQCKKKGLSVFTRPPDEEVCRLANEVNFLQEEQGLIAGIVRIEIKTLLHGHEELLNNPVGIRKGWSIVTWNCAGKATSQKIDDVKLQNRTEEIASAMMEDFLARTASPDEPRN